MRINFGNYLIRYKMSVQTNEKMQQIKKRLNLVACRNRPTYRVHVKRKELFALLSLNFTFAVL